MKRLLLVPVVLAFALTGAATLAVLTRAGQTVSGFWIPDTGCVPLRLTARLGGQAASAPLVRVLPFVCGE